MTAKALILAGYGLNCEEETAFAFDYNGLDAKIIHINDLIETPQKLESAQILAIPGGFSYGDDTGAGNAYAQKLKLSLMDELKTFIERDTLTIGICNGCQVLTNLGLTPPNGDAYGTRKTAVTYNENARYQCRWVDLKVTNDSPWLEGVKTMHIPVAHGEGRFMMDDNTVKTLQDNNQIAAIYTKDDEPANGEFPFNPNGSVADIAAMTDPSGRVLAMMPHPERGMLTTQRDDYMQLKDATLRSRTQLTETTDGMSLFANAASYFGIKSQKAA